MRKIKIVKQNVIVKILETNLLESTAELRYQLGDKMKDEDCFIVDGVFVEKD